MEMKRCCLGLQGFSAAMLYEALLRPSCAFKLLVNAMCSFDEAEKSH